MTIHISDMLKKSIEFAKGKLDWEPVYLAFTDKKAFYECPIRNRKWMTLSQSSNISDMKSNIKINVWEIIFNKK